jgi:hypothetical protein
MHPVRVPSLNNSCFRTHFQQAIIRFFTLWQLHSQTPLNWGHQGSDCVGRPALREQPIHTARSILPREPAEGWSPWRDDRGAYVHWQGDSATRLPRDYHTALVTPSAWHLPSHFVSIQ